MEDQTSNKLPLSVIVNLDTMEYSVAAGLSVDIVVNLSNPSTTGDYFRVGLFGIPPGWVTYLGPTAVWLPGSGQEKVTFTIRPPASGEGIAGSYMTRLQVISQSNPENRTDLELSLIILPAEKPKGTLALRVESSEIKAAPGSEVKIPVTISNHAPEADTLELSVEGVPTSWVSLPSPVISIAGGVEKKVEINLQIPAAPAIQTGSLTLKISARSQRNPQNTDGVDVKLNIAAFESQGRVGVMMNSVQFSTAPGDGITIPITVLNRGLAQDTFRLGVEGIPTNWVSTATPVVQLAAGERKEISLAIRPALTPPSQAGRYKFIVTVASQAAPEEIVRVDCILTVAAYSLFNVNLEPKEVIAGQPVNVRVKNEGNTPQIFQLSCTSPEDQLAFDYLPPEGAKLPAPSTPAAGQAADLTRINIAAGESAAFRFMAQPHKRPFFGGTLNYPYYVTVKSQQKQSPALQGVVMSSGVLPLWVLPVAVFVVILLFLIAIVLGRQSGSQAGNATQTAIAATALTTGVNQTYAAETALAAGATQTFSTEIAMALGSTQTAAASTALAGASTQTSTASTAQAEAATQTYVAGTLQALAATQTVSAIQTALTTQQTPTASATTQASPTSTLSQPTSTATASPTQPGLPRFGGVMLFVSDRDGNPEIYTLDDAGHIGRLTNNPASDVQPAWSPNMQKVAFTTNRDGNNEVYLMNADGSNPINLTNNPADDQYPTWSIDGQSIAFTTNRDGNYEIYVLNVSTMQVTNLTNNPANDTQPNWVHSTTANPAGESIVFTTTRDGNPEIYRMNTDGSGQINLSNNPANDQLAKGSPDGALIVFTTDRDGNQEVYTMSINGQGPANLSNNPASDFGPCWAPNQAWVAFTSDRSGNRDVYIIKPNGTQITDLTNNPSQDVISDWR